MSAQPDVYTLEQSCSAVAATCPCLNIPIAFMCPGTCGGGGRRLSRTSTPKEPVRQDDSVSIPDNDSASIPDTDSTLLLDAAFEGLRTLNRREEGQSNGDQRRRLGKCPI